MNKETIVKNYQDYKKTYDSLEDKDSNAALQLIGAMTALEQLCPELKESEDEKVRKSLKECIEWLRDDARWTDVYGSSFESVIAFLEKQNGNERENEGNSLLQSEQKPADKVKPKFKVGDFIVNDYCMGRVIEVTYDAYLLDTEQGIPLSHEHNAHLWTIQDAKEGDVLLSPSTPEGDKECPFIFKEIDKSGIVRFHAALLQSESFKIANGITNVMGYANAGYHTPATKEQRDLLFRKMKEAGYEWDAEHKQLKKIESQSAEWNEEDEDNLKKVISFLWAYCNVPHCAITHDMTSEMEKWLITLRERCFCLYHWKPTEEHINALECALQFDNYTPYVKTILKELLEQLKALYNHGSI